MAVTRCLEGHTTVQDSYRNYVRPFQELTCEVAGCNHPAVIWLDPEEAREYEWGTRTFWEPNTFATMRASNHGVEMLPWSLWAVSRPLFKRWRPSLQLRFRRRFANEVTPLTKTITS